MPELKSKPDTPLPRQGFGSPRFWRRVRLWEKKRGNRQTGSSRWGAAGETLFFSALSIVGLGTLAQLFALRFVWHSQNALTTNLGLWLSALLLVPLCAVSAYRAVYHALSVGNSAERIAAITNRAKNSELLAEVRPGKRTSLPTIPSEANLTNSPGIRLPFRLPSETSASWRLAIVAGFCILWNTSVAILFFWVLQRAEFHLLDLFRPSSWTLFRIVVLVYALIGFLATRYLFQLLAQAAAIGPTSVEISELPLRPGNDYRVFLSQSGHLHIDWLVLLLVCDEEVSFTDGTDTRTESRRVYESEIFRHESFEILPSEPFHCDCPVGVPSGAMHSFVTEHNAVTWKLVVRLQPKGTQPKSMVKAVTQAEVGEESNDEGLAKCEPDKEANQDSTTTRKSSSKLKAKARRRSKKRSSPWMRLLMSRFRPRRTKPSWPPVQRVFPLVVHPKS